MGRFVAVFRVEDLETWEAGFRTHGDLFRSQSTASPVNYAVSEEDNTVVLNGEFADLEHFLSALEQPDAGEAMKDDGIVEGSFRLFVLDRRFGLLRSPWHLERRLSSRWKERACATTTLPLDDVPRQLACAPDVGRGFPGTFRSSL